MCRGETGTGVSSPALPRSSSVPRGYGYAGETGTEISPPALPRSSSVPRGYGYAGGNGHGGQLSGASTIFFSSSRIWMCRGQTCSRALSRWPIGPFYAVGRRCVPTSPLRRFRNLLLFLVDMDMPEENGLGGQLSNASTIFFSSSRIWMCWGQTCSHAPHSRQALAMLWLRPTVFQ